MVSKNTKPPQDPPLVDLKVTNPVTYLKKWWAKIIGNEGVDIKLRIHPLTAFVMVGIIGSVGFGFGRLAIPDPIVKYLPILATPSPAPTPNPWRDTAFTGILRYTQSPPRFYLETGSGQAITLQVQTNSNLSKYIGKRIFAAGTFNEETKILKVSESQDLEVLPATPIPVATNPPSPSPTTAAE